MLSECRNLYKLGISAIKVNFTPSERKEKQEKENEDEEKLVKAKYYNTKPDMFMNEFMTLKSA